MFQGFNYRPFLPSQLPKKSGTFWHREKLAIAIVKCTMDPRALLNPENMYLFIY